MSIIVRVSYQDDNDLEKVYRELKHLLPVLEIAETKGHFKRAYLKEPTKPVRRTQVIHYD